MAILAQIPGRAHIKQCPGHGCIHLTYRKVTIHFESAEEFLALCRAWSTLLSQSLTQEDMTAGMEGWLIELSYQHLCLNLLGVEAVELGQLLQDAEKYLAQAALREESLDTHDWPEGDAFVLLPDFSRLPRLAAGIEE